VVRHYLLRSFFMVVLSFLGTTLNAATLEAQVDKKELVVGEHLTLTLALINSETRLRAQGINPNVDMTVLTDHFELGLPQANSRYSPFRNRGRSSSEIIVTLFPKEAGEFTIPAFHVDSETSSPITITVHDINTDAAPELFTRSGALKQKLWLREQTLVYLDLYHRVELKNAKLGGAIESEPKMQIQLSKLPQSDRTELYNGIKYNVTRTAWAVAPAINQEIKLFLPDVWVETKAGKQQRFPFTNITIKVLPLPASVPPQTLIGRPTLTQSILERSIKQHHTLPLEITLQIPGNVINLSRRPPELSFPDQLKVYAESGLRKLVDGNNNGDTTVTYTYYILPLAVGSFQLPDLHIPYFDPAREVMDEVVLQGQRLEVTAAAIPRMKSVLPSVQAITQTSEANSNNSNALPWKIYTLIITLLWLGTLSLWWHQKRNNKTPPSTTSKRETSFATYRHPLQQQLLLAFGTQTLEQGLLQWERQHGIDKALRTVVQQVQQHCYGEGDEKNIDTLQEAVNQLVEKIYKTTTGSDKNDAWSPKAFSVGKQH